VTKKETCNENAQWTNLSNHDNAVRRNKKKKKAINITSSAEGNNVIPPMMNKLMDRLMANMYLSSMKNCRAAGFVANQAGKIGSRGQMNASTVDMYKNCDRIIQPP
jgi:hypothetical protein